MTKSTQLHLTIFRSFSHTNHYAWGLEAPLPFCCLRKTLFNAVCLEGTIHKRSTSWLRQSQNHLQALHMVASGGCLFPDAQNACAKYMLFCVGFLSKASLFMVGLVIELIETSLSCPSERVLQHWGGYMRVWAHREHHAMYTTSTHHLVRPCLTLLPSSDSHKCSSISQHNIDGIF